MTPTPVAVAVLVMTAALLLAACGSQSDESDQSATADEAEVPVVAGPEPTPTPTPTAPPLPTATPATPSPAAAPSDRAAEATPSGFSLYDFRYCEILITAPDSDGASTTEVWGTPGVGPCDDEAWRAIDPDAVAAEFDATSVFMNGPRYFVVDGAVDTATGGGGTGVAAGGVAEVRSFGDVSMTLLATVADDGAESDAYAEELVVRTMTWTYGAGTEIYELVDPDGDVYVMQSYSLIQDAELEADDLATLGDRLDLPQGWSYTARVLDEPMQLGLSPDGAIVVQDELANSYQRDG